MQFKYTILYVENVTGTITFYEKAFGFKRKFISPDGDYGELITGETTLSFASHKLGESNFTVSYLKSKLNTPPFGIELAFTSNNIQEDFANAIKNGAKLLEEIKQKPWGQQVGYLKDNNGFIIEVCTPIK